MQHLTQLETELNALIRKGEMVEAARRFYSDNCTWQEGNNPPRTGGGEAQAEYLAGFFQTVTAVNAIRLHSQAIGDGVTMSEWTFDLQTTNGPILWNEVLRRQWKDGKVVSERFYTAA